MKVITNKMLEEILNKHSLWLKGESSGDRADLSGADLSKAYLSGADLRDAYLNDANLRGAYLSGADLSRADLSGADLRGANLRGANLKGAYLSGADLRDADLSGADLRGANLRGADLRDAFLSGADLRDAFLSGADLRDADLKISNLNDANDIYLPLACPEKGSFIGFKKVSNGKQIVELFIPTDAKRSSSTGRKCRCNKAKVISITNLDGSNCKSNKAKSSYDQSFIYTVGEYVEVKNFDDNRWNECAPGIHFFITREEAVRY